MRSFYLDQKLVHIVFTHWLRLSTPETALRSTRPKMTHERGDLRDPKRSSARPKTITRASSQSHMNIVAVARARTSEGPFGLAARCVGDTRARARQDARFIVYKHSTLCGCTLMIARKHKR